MSLLLATLLVSFLCPRLCLLGLLLRSHRSHRSLGPDLGNGVHCNGSLGSRAGSISNHSLLCPHRNCLRLHLDRLLLRLNRDVGRAIVRALVSRDVRFLAGPCLGFFRLLHVCKPIDSEPHQLFFEVVDQHRRHHWHIVLLHVVELWVAVVSLARLGSVVRLVEVEVVLDVHISAQVFREF